MPVPCKITWFEEPWAPSLALFSSFMPSPLALEAFSLGSEGAAKNTPSLPIQRRSWAAEQAPSLWFLQQSTLGTAKTWLSNTVVLHFTRYSIVGKVMTCFFMFFYATVCHNLSDNPIDSTTAAGSMYTEQAAYKQCNVLQIMVSTPTAQCPCESSRLCIGWPEDLTLFILLEI